MTDSLAHIIGFVLVTALAVLGPLLHHRNYGRVLTALLMHQKSTQGDFFGLVQAMFEKITNNPELAMKLHVQERIHRTNLATSIDRETLRTEKPTPPPPPKPPGWHPEGIETDDLEAARR